MKIIAVYRVDLEFNANQVTQGDDATQVYQAIAVINQILKRESLDLNAQVFAHYDEIDIDPYESTTKPQPSTINQRT